MKTKAGNGTKLIKATRKSNYHTVIKMIDATKDKNTGERNERKVIVSDRSRVPCQVTLRLSARENTRKEQLFELYRNDTDYSRAVFMRYIFHLGLEAAEREMKK